MYIYINELNKYSINFVEYQKVDLIKKKTQ